ncbi:hypothetical protein GCM10010302_78640 [Streptomyces polychromogenes]|uniref:Transposase n=1 Tax=Streptomyces polychromogenes TaxID=67342 RepID=A0ABN0W7I6_9ACTN
MSAASNRSKGDQSPGQWSPPSHAYWCTYSRAWTHIKHVYRLNVSDAERDQLNVMLDLRVSPPLVRCGSRRTTAAVAHTMPGSWSTTGAENP